jgi:hypothetical protein
MRARPRPIPIYLAALPPLAQITGRGPVICVTVDLVQPDAVVTDSAVMLRT